MKALKDDSKLVLSFLKEYGLKGMLMGPRNLENNSVLYEYIKEVCYEL